jgi:hemerythrin-like domain-containing protein
MSPDPSNSARRSQRVSLLPHAPSAGFEQPFEMLQACHERVLRMLGLLLRLMEHVRTQGIDQQAQDAARDVMRYFDRAGPAHHEDEERHVLPVLRETHDPDALGWAERLHHDHLDMERQWAQVRKDLQDVVNSSAPAQDIDHRWRAFDALYRAHIDLEEALAYPKAQALMSVSRRDLMGAEMTTRRGVPGPIDPKGLQSI